MFETTSESLQPPPALAPAGAPPWAPAPRVWAPAALRRLRRSPLLRRGPSHCRLGGAPALVLALRVGGPAMGRPAQLLLHPLGPCGRRRHERRWGPRKASRHYLRLHRTAPHPMLVVASSCCCSHRSRSPSRWRPPSAAWLHVLRRRPGGPHEHWQPRAATATRWQRLGPGMLRASPGGSAAPPSHAGASRRSQPQS